MFAPASTGSDRRIEASTMQKLIYVKELSRTAIIFLLFKAGGWFWRQLSPTLIEIHRSNRLSMRIMWGTTPSKSEIESIYQ